MHVAFHRRHEDSAGRAGHFAGLLRRHERLEIRHRALHRARALDHLRQEHLAGAKQVADRLHAVHQRPFDHVQSAAKLDARFLRVFLDEIDNAVNERKRQTRFDRLLAPREIQLALLAGAFDVVGKLHQPLGGIGASIEEHVFNALE